MYRDLACAFIALAVFAVFATRVATAIVSARYGPGMTHSGSVSPDGKTWSYTTNGWRFVR